MANPPLRAVDAGRHSRSTLTVDRLDYPKILQDALRDVVRRVLAQVAEHGLPGEHHFYIAFRTGHPGVAMPSFLRERYPQEMTIILQNQFWDLTVFPDSFAVELNFNASRHALTVPFAALTSFADPSAELALRFEAEPAAAGGAGETQGTAELSSETAGVQGTIAPPQPADPDKKGAVIRFDPGRRK
jgi:hypothetical protein